MRFYFRSNLNTFLFPDSDIKQLCYIIEFLRHNVSLNFYSVRNWYIQVEIFEIRLVPLLFNIFTLTKVFSVNFACFSLFVREHSNIHFLFSLLYFLFRSLVSVPRFSTHMLYMCTIVECPYLSFFVALFLSLSPRFLECPCLTSQFLFVSSSGPGCPSLYK